MIEQPEIVINCLADRLVTVEIKLSQYRKNICANCGTDLNTCGQSKIIEEPCGCCSPGEPVKVLCVECGLKNHTDLFFERILKERKKNEM